MTYKILTNRSASKLEQEVNEFIGNGYIPLGGVSSCSFEVGNIMPEVRLCQAVIKKEPSKQARIEELITRRDGINASMKSMEVANQMQEKYYGHESFVQCEKDLLDIAKEFMKL